MKMVVVIDAVQLGTGLSMSAIVLVCFVGRPRDMRTHFTIPNSLINIFDQSWKWQLTF